MVALEPSFCPTCGTELTARTVEDRSRSYCPSCDDIVWRNPVPTASVAVVDDTGPALSVLLVRRSQPPDAGEWGLPAGFIEHDESAVDAAARELHEETALAVDPAALTLADVGSFVHPSGRPLVTICYAVRRDRTTGEPVAGSDADAVRFWTLEAISDADETLRSYDRDRISRGVERLPARDI